jgi:hypothetical protein
MYGVFRFKTNETIKQFLFLFDTRFQSILCFDVIVENKSSCVSGVLVQSLQSCP